MKQIWAAGILAITLTTPAYATYTPVYAGVQLDSNTLTGLLGYQIDKNWATEAHASRFVTTIRQAGATNETKITAIGLSALYMIPMKLNGGSPYSFFGKISYEHMIQDVTYGFPNSVTYSGSYTNRVNRGRYGIGTQYDLYEHMSGRAGIDLYGPNRSVYLTVIFKF